MNAHGIALVASGSFPGSCTLDKITQEMFYILYIARYHVKIMRCRLDYARRVPECFCLQILLWERKKEWSALKQGDCHSIVCSVSSVCILISTSNKYCIFSYLDICRYFGLLELPQQCASYLLFHLPNLCFHSKVCGYLCMYCLNAVSYNILCQFIFSFPVFSNFKRWMIAFALKCIRTHFFAGKRLFWE